MDKSDEEITLSAGALDALAAFYSERDEKEKRFEDLKTSLNSGGNVDKFSITAIPEDWNTSQFWFTDETATALAQALLEGTDSGSAVAVVSTPSVFVQIKDILQRTYGDATKPLLVLFEYDERFNIFPEFIPYDFAHPLRLPEDLKGRFDRIIYDPPFHSTDCQTRMAVTTRWLAKPSTRIPSDSSDMKRTRIVLCTGEKVETLVLQLLCSSGLQATDFELRHSNHLMNGYRCYANFESCSWTLKT